MQLIQFDGASNLFTPLDFVTSVHSTAFFFCSMITLRLSCEHGAVCQCSMKENVSGMESNMDQLLNTVTLKLPPLYSYKLIGFINLTRSEVIKVKLVSGPGSRLYVMNAKECAHVTHFTFRSFRSCCHAVLKPKRIARIYLLGVMHKTL